MTLVESFLTTYIPLHGKDWLYTPAHFNDIAGSSMITMVLKGYMDAKRECFGSGADHSFLLDKKTESIFH